MIGDRNKIESKKRLQKAKDKRIQRVIGKAYELSHLCHLDVNVAIYDPKQGRLIEATSSPDFTIEDVVHHKCMNPHLILTDIKSSDRKFMP